MTGAAKSLLELIAWTGVQATALALVAFVFARAGKMRPGWQAAIWLVVLAKFALPWGPALPFSLADIIAALRHHTDAAPIPVLPVYAAPPVAAAPGIGWLVAAIVWFAGAAFVIVRAARSQLSAVRVAKLAPPAPLAAQHLLKQLAAAHRMRAPMLVVGDEAIGPYVVGALRPIIGIPPQLCDDPALLRAALLHELAHVRRRDALARIVQVAATAAFWFWPVVRFASRRLERAREAACDAWAIGAADLPRPAYARLLVRMSQLRTAAAGAHLAAPHALDHRVAAVLGPPARGRLGLVHGAALLVWIGLALGGARSASARGDKAVCKYTPVFAEQLRAAHPEADLDGDGVLTRDEACEFQAELRHRVQESADEVSRMPEADETLLTEPLCCNCTTGGVSSPDSLDATTCNDEEGVSR